MKKQVSIALLALGLTLGGVGTLSAASNPSTNAGAARQQGVCVNEDCPRNGDESRLRIGGRGKAQGGGQGVGQGLAPQDGSGRQLGAERAKGTKGGPGAGVRGENCPNENCPNEECPNDGVRPMDGSGQKNGRRNR